jgi:hypothetical protein
VRENIWNERCGEPWEKEKQNIKCQVLAIMRRKKKGAFDNNFTETPNTPGNFFFR